MIHLHIILRGEGGGPLDGDHCDIGSEDRAASEGGLRRDYYQREDVHKFYS